jgi:dCMP deaminase
MTESIDKDLDLLRALGILAPDEGLEAFAPRLAEMIATHRNGEITAWDHRGMAEAVQKTDYSKDPRRKVGCYIAGSRNKPLAWGYNGFPRGIDDSPARLHYRPAKLKLMAHAERNALDNAETPVVGATLYVTQIPCSVCANSIIQRGIARVVCPEPDQTISDSWRKDAAISMVLFAEAGVQLDWYSGPALETLALKRRLYLQGPDAPNLDSICAHLNRMDDTSFRRWIAALDDPTF